MCGIAGRLGSRPPDAALKLALAALAHRGPDSEGRWQDERVTLLHRRLSILDLSPNGRQPMASEDGRVRLVFNGEIYNYRELALLLTRRAFRSRADTEVLLHGYEQWGMAGLLDRIRGMFAFAIWDARTRVLHLARDHFGEKPLYYSSDAAGFTFASTLPALLELGGKSPDVSLPALRQYLACKAVPAPGSVVSGCWKLPPAHRIEVRGTGDVTIERYWQPSCFAGKDDHTPDEWVARIRDALRASVSERLASDVPLGAFLSGGIDSSLVVAVMHDVGADPIRTISMGFREHAFNELPHAREVATRFETVHSEHVLVPDAAGVLPALVYHCGEPFADAAVLPTYYLAQAARQSVSVVLTGDGGDELFGGYAGVQAARLAHALSRFPGVAQGFPARALAAMERAGVRRAGPLRWVAEFARAHGSYVFDPAGHSTFRGWEREVFAPSLLAAPGPDAQYRELWQAAATESWVERALYVDMMSLLPNTFLHKTDVATMAFGLEARSPFLDTRLAELAWRIPPRLRVGVLRTKPLLRRLAREYLPSSLVERKKHGFFMPISEWCRGALAPAIRELLLSERSHRRGFFQAGAVQRLIGDHQARRRDHGRRLWMLLMLELWCLMFVDRELNASDDLHVLGSSRREPARPAPTVKS